MALKESAYEKPFVEWVRSLGGTSPKGPAMQYKGIPDRIVVLPNGGGTVWVEFKNGVYNLTPMQKWWRDLLMSSDPERYFTVTTKDELEYCKKRCLEFMGMIDTDIWV